MKIIIISGTPGTGKTSVSKKLSEIANAKYISLNKLAVSEQLILKYDKKRDTQVVDLKMLIPHIINQIETYKKTNIDFLLIESHFSDFIPEKYIDCAIVLRCNPNEK